MTVVVRSLERQEVEAIWIIDRSEVHHFVYRLRNSELMLTPAYFALQGWPSDQVEQDTPALYTCFDRGGAFIGAFQEDQLIGIVIIDNLPLGVDQNQLQLKYLYVSQAHRQQGIVTRLFDAARAIARAQGVAFLYISATPTENTVKFYVRRGCYLASTPNLQLLAMEPDDIHLLYPI